MNLDIALAVFSAVATTAALLLGAAYRAVAREKGEAQAELRAAHNRLYAAWKDGFAVPLTDPTPAPVDAVEPLCAELQAIVDDWEDEAGQASQLRVIRSQLARGKSQAEVLLELSPEPV